jgi:4-amino-4-deoxy-L-arabinose transferase-like glycosyltransferase
MSLTIGSLHKAAPAYECDIASKSDGGRCITYATVEHRAARWIAALGVLLGLTLMIWTWVRAASMSADGAHYMELAERAWRLGASAAMDWYAGPGYPVVVGWIYGLTGELEFAGRLTSFCFGVGTLIGIGLLSYRLFGRTVAWLSVALLAVHTTFVRHSVMAETDAAYGCWLVWSILLVWELAHATKLHRQALMACLAAVTLGLGYLTRPEGVPLAGLLGLWYLWRRRGIGDAARPASVSHGIGRRLAWSCLIATIFVAISFPYLVRLRAELGRWSLSGKERSIVLKFVPDKRNYEDVLKLGVTGALLHKPSNILHWMPYHAYWGIPQFVKSLNPIVVVLAIVGLVYSRKVAGATGSIALLLWVSVPFILFFFLTFPGRRYFMQAMPQWTILAAIGTVEIARAVATWRFKFSEWLGRDRTTNAPARAAKRAFAIALAVPTILMIASTVWGNRNPIEESLSIERAVGERILELGGPGRRVLTFSVAAFYARGDRVPLWGPMEGIVRCHGYGKPRSYDDFVSYVRSNGVEYVVLDHDLRADCPDFLDRVRPEDFQLVADDIVDHHGPHLVFRVGVGAVEVVEVVEEAASR